MANEHTLYSGEVDVPEEAIQIIDPNVITSKFCSFSPHCVIYS